MINSLKVSLYDNLKEVAFMNDDKVIVILNIKRLSKKYDVEVPLYITANDLVKD